MRYSFVSKFIFVFVPLHSLLGHLLLIFLHQIWKTFPLSVNYFTSSITIQILIGAFGNTYISFYSYRWWKFSELHISHVYFLFLYMNYILQILIRKYTIFFSLEFNTPKDMNKWKHQRDFLPPSKKKYDTRNTNILIKGGRKSRRWSNF